MALKIKKTIITLEILSDVDDNPQDMQIANVVAESIDGGFSMRVIDGDVSILEGDEAIKACKDQATDPNFFAMEDVNLSDDESYDEFVGLVESGGMDSHLKSIWSEIRDTFEDEGILHIDAWTTEDENDEDGHTIAKFNTMTGKVEYLDERARTDAYAQETIQFHINNYKEESERLKYDR